LKYPSGSSVTPLDREVKLDMNKWLSLAGGLVGGYALLKAPLDGTFLNGLNPLADGIGLIAMLVFSGALIYSGVRDWFQR